MLCLDVNVLIYAHRAAVDGHEQMRSTLERRLNGAEAVGVPDVVASGFVRIITSDRLPAPSPTASAWGFLDAVLDAPAGRLLRAGPRHFAHFRHLYEQVGATGNRVPDAFIAAYAIEHGATLVTADRDFRAFDDLDVVHPADL